MEGEIMKTVDKLVGVSIVKTSAVTIILCTMMLVSVKLFTNIDAFLQKDIPFIKILFLAVLYVPSSLIQVLAPSMLFSAAFTFSQLTANNELICLYNATISKKRLYLPVIFLGIACSLFQLGFSEFVGVPSDRKANALEAETIGATTTKDSRNITLSDYEDGYVFFAHFYSDKKKTAQTVTFLLLDDANHVRQRIDAPTVQWDEENASWIFHDATVTTVSGSLTSVTTTHESEHVEVRTTLLPDMLRDNSSDINTMTIPVAKVFLANMKKLDANLYRGYAVDFAQRILGCLAPLVMLFIACTITYRFKKNVLLFTIIISIFIAVIYYVVQMVTLILARQGVLAPTWAMVIPMIVITCIAGLERMAFREGR
jgi:lipopolysaccharide export system permease protein